MFAEEAGMLGEKSISLEENVLQKHAAFFDINKDGVIYPWETFQGFHCFSFSLQFSTFFLLLQLIILEKTRLGFLGNNLVQNLFFQYATASPARKDHDVKEMLK
ncbi:hypothetical protein V8G54_014156 [Vigna mungo]|uniref:Uncharacterized protein n=1 Tax=Vigna mungo TaxID=3915 RepID=A0AAQ3NH14_VIGMU